MKTKIHLILILSLIVSSSYLHAVEIDATHFRSGIFGNPPIQYEFKNSSLRGYFTSFPLDSVREVLGDENFNKINIEYWIYSSIEDVEMAMVEKLELSTINFKNSIDFPLADGSIGINCWHSIEESGAILFSWNNAMIFITPKNENSFDPKIIEESTRKIASVLRYTDGESLTDFEKVVPAINNFFYPYYPLNWEDIVKIRIEATDPQNKKLFYRKYGDGLDSFSEDSVITTTLYKNTDSIDTNDNEIKMWVWNEDHIVASAKKEFRFMNYPGKYMLTEDDLPDFVLIREYIDYWVGYKQGTWGIEQHWRIPDGEKNDYILIYYFESDNEQDAIFGTSYDAHIYSAPFYFGSLSNEISANISYVSDYNSLISAQKWNIGYKILAQPNLLDSTEFSLLSLSHKILTKINDFIPESYKGKDINLKQRQIPENEFNQLTENATTLLTDRDFTIIKTDDTKWIYLADSLIMGLRKQWANEKSLFTINVVKLDNEKDAEQIGKISDTINYGYSPFCWLNNLDSIDHAFESLYGYLYYYPAKFISATGVIDNYAIYFHYQNKDSIDFEFFKSVLKSFADDGTSVENIKQNDLKIYPNPANETFTIETQNPETTFVKLLDSTGRLIKTFTLENGTNTYNISELESGVYFIQIPQKEGMMVEKLVKK